MKTISTYSLKRWVEQHRDELDRPLMNHERVWNEGFIVMLFNGATPPERSDFHINTTPEFFYQIEGQMYCKLLVDGQFEELIVEEGEMFYIPPMVPHLNRREDGSTGLVIHQGRAPEALDTMVWFCNGCAHELHRVSYRYTELKENLKEHIRAFLSDEQLRTCEKCGEVFPADQGYL